MKKAIDDLKGILTMVFVIFIITVTIMVIDNLG